MASKKSKSIAIATVVTASSLLALYGAYLEKWEVVAKRTNETIDVLRRNPVFENLPPWLIGVIVITCPALVAVSALFPIYIRRRKRRILRSQRDNARLLLADVEKERVFRLDQVPISLRGKDGLTFQRADGAHVRILAWIRNSRRGILYVTGLSGTGKSSLLSAYVVPMLCREGKGMNGTHASVLALMLRAVDDIQGALREALTRPGTVWEKPPNFDQCNIRELLSKAVKHLGEGSLRLVLVFDQFEEILIDLDAATKSPTIEFLKSLVASPIPEVKCVLTLRAEYGKDLESLGLPKRMAAATMQEVEPFTVSEGASFLKKGLGRYPSVPKDNDLIAMSLAREAERLVDIPGRVTPIALNMIGLMYTQDQVLGSYLAKCGSDRVDGLLATYVRQCVRANHLIDLGPVVLEKLVTRDGRREHAKRLIELADGIPSQEGMIETTLLTLACSGLVREVGTKWEVTHDFLAPILRRVLDRIQGSLWRRLQPWLPVPVAILLTVIAGGVWGVGQTQKLADSNAFNECARFNAQSRLVEINKRITPEAIRHIRRLEPEGLAFDFHHPAPKEGLQLLGGHRSMVIRSLYFDGNATLLDMGTVEAGYGASRMDNEGVGLLVAQNSVWMDLSTLSLSATRIDDDGIRALAAPGAALTKLTVLDLSHTEVGDKGVMAIVAPNSVLKGLTLLDLSYTNVGDEGIKALTAKNSALDGLNKLNLIGTAVTDKGIASLAASDLPVSEVLLTRTSVSCDGIKALAMKRSIKKLRVWWTGECKSEVAEINPLLELVQY